MKNNNNVEIEYIAINDVMPYKNNPRNNKKAVAGVAESIQKFGFKVPVVVDANNVIVCGHTRYLASKKLGLKEIPCIIANDLTEEEIKAFRLADNKVAEAAEWDLGKLAQELNDISIDMSGFGFDLGKVDDFDFDFEQDDDEKEDEEIEDDVDDGYKSTTERNCEIYNLDLINYVNFTDNFWQMPIIQNDNVIPSGLIRFDHASVRPEKNVGLHFFAYDFLFERVWRNPDKYIEFLKEYECILSPDFSLYMDMPMPMKVWNIYRSRLIGAYYQSQGIKVIPTISWAERETFKFCFLGIPEGSVIAVSTVGVVKDEEATEIWRNGMSECIKQIKPSTIVVYGGKLEYDFGGIKTVYFDNELHERLANYRKER